MEEKDFEIEVSILEFLLLNRWLMLLRLHSSDVDVRWLLAMSPRFLVGRLKSDKRRIHVWDRENGYVKLPMEDAPRL